MSKTKLDVNNLLREAGYRTRPDFGEIAKFAVTAGSTPEAILKAVETRFGKAWNKIPMLDKPRPYELFAAHGTYVEHAAIEQLETALRLPVAVEGAGMPDIHPGYSLPIGGVVVLDHAVSPAFVGYDIGCRMTLAIIDNCSITPETLAKPDGRNAALEILQESCSCGLGSVGNSVDNDLMHDVRWNIPAVKPYKELAASQLGSIGSGNHFLNMVVVHMPGMKDRIGLLLHSGSRGTGNKLGHHYAQIAEDCTRQIANVPDGYGWFDIGSHLGKEYMDVMNLMCSYSFMNHILIINKVCSQLACGRRFYSTPHNYAQEGSSGMVIHRKGAISAKEWEIGIIPGSSGTNSYLVSGRGNRRSLYSASHGAGRVCSRSKAKERFANELGSEGFTEYMEERGITCYGVSADETYLAYKNIEAVINAQVDAGIIEPIATLQPRVVLMGGTEKQDDGD